MVKKIFFLIICSQIIDICAQSSEIITSDTPIRYIYDLPQNTYHKYCKNIYSQNGEDGIIEQLVKELGIDQGTFCEFGASNGITSSNTYNLIKNYNFSGMAIELNHSSYQQCVSNYKNFNQVRVFHGAVLYNDKSNDLNTWLIKGNLPKDFDILSIDIDSDDYYIWENLTEFQPKIVIIEANSYRDPVHEELPGKPSQEYSIDILQNQHKQRIAMGASFISIVRLGLEKGYIPVSFTGNIIFIRKDLIHNLKQFPYKISNNPYDYISLYTHVVLWDNTWYTNTLMDFNVAIRDYYLKYNSKQYDMRWVKKRMTQILNNKDIIW